MLKRIIVMSLFAALALSAYAFAAPPDNYTGKMVMMGTGISIDMAHLGDKTRTESPAIKGLVSISMPAQKKSVSMYVPGKVYFEHTYDSSQGPSLHDSNVVFEKKKIDKETIDGHPCEKSETVYYTKDKPDDKYKATIWEATDLGGLIIRYEMKMADMKKPIMPGNTNQSVVTEIKDIKVGAATASMFEVPKDYKKVSTMQELMSGAINSLNPAQMPQMPSQMNGAGKNNPPGQMRSPMDIPESQKPEKDGNSH
ncbi:hypothetical protein [Candidatus Magnetominusculus dajiuhuensis]|uniref:hypothetical protein n=1 Tax=Candidatus Magnetominusculus dajiuhuensis TaxID=3137712 RepID=UPI003B431F3D